MGSVDHDSIEETRVVLPEVGKNCTCVEEAEVRESMEQTRQAETKGEEKGREDKDEVEEKYAEDFNA